MNSYFASVEQQANPFWRGRSVGVCSYLSPRGCLIASSMEAKARGIRTGCRVQEARRLDPRIVLVENEPAKYRSVTAAISQILNRYTDRVEPYSIDESFLDLTGWAKDYQEADNIGRKIQQEIRQEVGEWLYSSAGIAWTKWLAKFASDLAPKKGRLLIASQAGLEEILRGRALTEAWGIAERTAARLRELGIHDLLSLKRSDPAVLRRAFGLAGYYLWANVNGREITVVSAGRTEAKSLGHSYCLPRKTTDKDYLWPMLYKLCAKTGRRLRASGREAAGMAAFCAYAGGGGAGWRWRTRQALFTDEEIFREISLWFSPLKILLPVRMLAVSVFRLRPMSGQLSFWADGRLRRLALAMDKINDRYGDYTVRAGLLYGLDKAAPDRIGFRKTD